VPRTVGATVGDRDRAEDAAIESTASLLMRVRQGDAPARERLAGRYMSMLARWAHGRLPRAARDLVDTDDLVQSTLIRAFNHLDSFQPRGEGAFLAYLRQILLNQIRDESRRARRRPEHVDLDESAEINGARSPLEETIGRERLERYEASLARLGEGQREAVILRLEMGMRYRDIAESLNVPTANAARALVGRGLVNMARMMRDHHD
jgi:RNA polymerase sigma-70 factor (ECF subfamily)